jgi:cytochrome c
MRMQAKIIPAIALAAGAALLAPLAPAGAAESDAAAGRTVFEKRCTGCHALDHEKVGPRLAGVVGRKAGAISTFPYSDAVKKSGVVWNEAALNTWLTDPETMIPDNDMTFRLDNPAERSAIIAFLKETSK